MEQRVETTILNTQPFWMLLEMNTLWCLFKSIADLCFTGPEMNIDHTLPVEKWFRCESIDRQTDGQTLPNRRARTNTSTDKQTDATKRIISPASRSIIMEIFVIKWQDLLNTRKECPFWQILPCHEMRAISQGLYWSFRSLWSIDHILHMTTRVLLMSLCEKCSLTDGFHACYKDIHLWTCLKCLSHVGKM